MKKILASVLAASMALSLTACGGNGTTTSTTASTTQAAETTKAAENSGTETTAAQETVKAQEGKHEIEDLVLAITASTEMNDFNILHSQGSENSKVLVNMIDGLLEADTDGRLVPCIAEEWGSDDGGLTWTFKLRDGVKWVDVNGNEKADCTAYDWVTGMEWVLNAYKNEGNNTSMPIEMIKGASEYVEYTKGLSEEEGRALTAGEGSKFAEMVGVEAVDEHTLVYTCIDKIPYFDSVAIYGCLFPMHEDMIAELGIDGVKSMNNKDFWYNGAYIMTEFISGNSKVLEKNPTYWDTESYRFNTVTIRCIESSDLAYTLFENGDIDYCDLTEANLSTISGDTNHKYYKNLVELRPTSASTQFYFNYDKRNKDGSVDEDWNKAAANLAFRKAFYYGFDYTDYLKRINAINPMKAENNYYTVEGLAFTEDGTDYLDIVKEKVGLPESDGEHPTHYDKDLAEQYKKQAMEELSALGVTFPIKMDYYIKASSQSDLDGATVLKDTLEACLGTDFIQLELDTYVTSFTSEIRNAKLHSLTANGWVGDYGDPINFLGQMSMYQENAVYSNRYTYIKDVEETEATKDLIAAFTEFSDLVDEASAITSDLSARFDKFADAEKVLIDNVLCMPISKKVSWALTKINPYSKMYVKYGSMNEKMKNWETSAEPYTTEEIAALAK